MFKRSLISLSVALVCMSAHATSYYMLTPIVNAAAQQSAGTQTKPDIAVSLTSYALPSGQVGVPYTGFDFKPLLFVTGDAAYSGTGVGWSVASGSLPAGLTLNANGTLTGTPTTAGDSSFEIKASYKTKTGKQAYQVAVVSVNVALTTANPSSAQVGIAYQYDLKPLLTVNGDTNFNANNVTWSVVNSTLPAGLSLRTDGTISGIPTAASSGTVTARATYLNAQGEQTYQVVSHEITVSLASATISSGIVGQPYTYDLKPLVTVNTDGIYTAGVNPTWTIVSGTLPSGLTLNTNGTITGTPTSATVSPVTLKATYLGASGERTYQFITFDFTISLATTTLPTSDNGASYLFNLGSTLSVTGDPSYDASGVLWGITSGSLPSGLTLNSTTGIISGTAPDISLAGATFGVSATYKAKTAQQSYTIYPNTDPYWNNVVLMLHMDGIQGSATYADAKGHSITATNSSISTNAKYGTGAGTFNGTSLLSTPASTDFYFGTGDFTIEGWINLNKYPTTNNAWNSTTWAQWMVVWETGTASLADGQQLRLNQTQLAFGINDTTLIAAPHGLSLNKWHHVAVTRTGTQLRLFTDGVQIATAPYAAQIPTTLGATMFVGAETAQGAYFDGLMDDVRITKGVARYTSNFTIPTQAMPGKSSN